MVRDAGVGSGLGALHGNRPGNVAEQKTNGADKVHDAAADLDDEERDDNAAEETPAGNRNVDLLDVGRVGEANELEKVPKVIPSWNVKSAGRLVGYGVT